MEKLPAAAGGVGGGPLWSHRFLSLLTFAEKLTVCFAANENQAISFSPLNQARWLLLALLPLLMLEFFFLSSKILKDPSHLQICLSRSFLAKGAKN